MKTTPFLIRVAICCLLALIPLEELENQIYSSRMRLRGEDDRPSKVLILDVEPSLLYNVSSYRSLYLSLRGKGATAIVVAPMQTQSLRHGSSGFNADSDGEIRRAILKPEAKEPSLTYFAWAQTRINEAPPVAETSPHLIHFSGPAGTMERCRVSRAEDPCSSVPNFSGFTLILTDETTESPLFNTPFGMMSFTELLANDLRTVLEGPRIRFAPFPVVALLVIAMVLLGAFYLTYYPVHISATALISTGAVAVFVFFQLVFRWASFYLPSSNIVVALLSTYLVFTGHRLAFQDALQWRALKKAQFLREFDQMKTNFLSLMSHDLKTPIAKIQAVADRMRREKEFRPELIDSIENSNRELRNSISSILTLSKVESQKIVLNKRSNDINQLIEQAIERTRPLASQKSVGLESDLEPLFSVECDEELVRQVLTNLIDNAVKFSPSGSKVCVRSREEEKFVRVEVEDFGPGIAKDQLPKMFRKFSSLKGTGLGLYLSKYFIELHGGTISLKSQEGKGSIFTVKLPLNSI